ncbi:MAG: hypothetical protein LPK19_08625, partial [Hymenobacteraceae bacterium]|nr:hypothetical protein [Hymenobacteraceae bacterium]MDX5396282.1 hypothetical protein [Hymenobacteraceae bacterium]MDX5512343.1 hypothetical protein [Hymenobacteraceae bacterium]
MRNFFYLWLSLFFLQISSITAQPVPADSAEIAGAPVIHNRDTLFFIYQSVGSFNKTERAAAISKRINQLAEARYFIPDSVKVVEHALSTDVVYNDQVLLSVTEADAAAAQIPRQELAELYTAKISESVQQSAEQNSFKTIVVEIALALLVILVFFLLIKYVNKFFHFIFRKIEEQQDKLLKGFKIKEYELLTPEREVAVVITFARFIRLLVLVLLVYILLPVLFSIFPQTEGYAQTLFLYILTPLRKIGRGF